MEFEDRLAANYCCFKCCGKSCVTRVVRLGRSLPGLLDPSSDKYVLVTCTLCGYTETYSCLAFAQDAEPAEAAKAAKPAVQEG